ncbi:MAG: hypothetical protein IJS09_09475 [Treponema sp.]|nr:hypothetical protein [Treponema sp.]
MNGFRFFVTRIVLGVFVCLYGAAAFAQTVSLKYKGTGGYSLVERTNLRRYVNGKYVGLTSREVRSFISPSLSPDPAYENPRHQFYGDHAIVKALENTSDEAYIANVAEVLLDQALLVSGAELKNPSVFVTALNALLTK